MKKAILVCIGVILILLSSITPAYAATYDTTGLINGEVYYIKNVKSGLYLDVYYASGSNGTGVNQCNFNGNANQRWKLKYSNGYYQIVPMHAQTKALNVYGGANTNYTDIVIWNSSTTDNAVLWKISRNSDGTYRILSKCSNNTKGLAVKGASVSDGAKIIQHTYENSAERNDDWILERVSKGTANIFTNKITGNIDSTVLNSKFVTSMNALGYQSNYYKDSSASVAYGKLKNNDVTFICCHGDTINGIPAAGMLFKDSSGNLQGHLNASKYISDLPNQYGIDQLDKNSLAKSKCVIYMGCSTAVTWTNASNGNKYNLVNSTYDKGAHFVLGTTKIVYEPYCWNWVEDFLNRIDDGVSIEESIAYANLYNQGWDKNIKYVGDKYQRLK